MEYCINRQWYHWYLGLFLDYHFMISNTHLHLQVFQIIHSLSLLCACQSKPRYVAVHFVNETCRRDCTFHSHLYTSSSHSFWLPHTFLLTANVNTRALISLLKYLANEHVYSTSILRILFALSLRLCSNTDLKPYTSTDRFLRSHVITRTQSKLLPYPIQHLARKLKVFVVTLLKLVSEGTVRPNQRLKNISHK